MYDSESEPTSPLLVRVYDSVPKSGASSQVRKYGFPLDTQVWGKGMGSVLTTINMACHHAVINDMELVFSENEYRTRWFDGGSRGPADDPVKLTYHSYFEGIRVVPNQSITEYWPDCLLNGTYVPRPSEIENITEWYSNLAKKMYVYSSSTEREIEDRVVRSGFNPNTDVALHIRRTDKINSEVGDMPVSEHVQYCINLVKKFDSKVRVFLCTDDIDIVPECKRLFNGAGVEMAYDESQTADPVHWLREQNKANSEAIVEENIRCLSVIEILRRALHVVGGRYTNLFRIVELLRYPRPVLNIKDGDTYVQAYYTDVTKPVNPLHYRRYELDIGNRLLYNDPSRLVRTPIGRIRTCHNFIPSSVVDTIITDMKDYKDEWWSRTAESAMISNSFSSGHYNKCRCFVCRLNDTAKSREIINEVDYLTEHTVRVCRNGYVVRLNNSWFKKHDSYHLTVILFLCNDWSAHNGGLLHVVANGTAVVPEKGLLVVLNSREEYFISQVVSGTLDVYVAHYECI